MNDTNEQERKIEKKLVYYKDKSKEIHIELGNNKFYNGRVHEINRGYMLFMDNKLGELPIFFDEIVNIEPKKKKK